MIIDSLKQWYDTANKNFQVSITRLRQQHQTPNTQYPQQTKTVTYKVQGYDKNLQFKQQQYQQSQPDTNVRPLSNNLTWAEGYVQGLLKRFGIDPSKGVFGNAQRLAKQFFERQLISIGNQIQRTVRKGINDLALVQVRYAKKLAMQQINTAKAKVLSKIGITGLFNMGRLSLGPKVNPDRPSLSGRQRQKEKLQNMPDISTGKEKYGLYAVPPTSGFLSLPWEQGIKIKQYNKGLQGVQFIDDQGNIQQGQAVLTMEPITDFTFGQNGEYVRNRKVIIRDYDSLIHDNLEQADRVDYQEWFNTISQEDHKYVPAKQGTPLRKRWIARPGHTGLVKNIINADFADYSDKDFKVYRHDPLNLFSIFKQEDLQDVQKMDLSQLWFYDIYNKDFIPFRNTVTDITDLASSMWQSRRPLGRPDNFYIYGGVNDRDITIDFKVVCNSRKQLKYVWGKVNRLYGLTFPNIKGSDPYKRMIAPLIRFKLGDLYNNQLAHIRVVTVTIGDQDPWDFFDVNNINQENYINEIATVPFIFNINCQLTLMYDEVPTTKTKHFVRTKEWQNLYYPQQLKTYLTGVKQTDDREYQIQHIAIGGPIG